MSGITRAAKLPLTFTESVFMKYRFTCSASLYSHKLDNIDTIYFCVTLKAQCVTHNGIENNITK